MNLNHFPPEILTHLLSPPDSSFLSIQLWNTGDLILQHGLARAMLSLDLRAPRISFKIPSIVSKLPRLRHFAIESGAQLTQSRHLSAQKLEMLPRTLESLELDVAQIHVLLTNHVKCLDGHEIIVSSYPLGTSRCIDLNALFPNLTSLSLVNNPMYLAPEDLFPALPSTLTELSSERLYVRSLFASLLPRSLERLDCEIYFDIGNVSFESYRSAWFDAPPFLSRVKCLRVKGQWLSILAHPWLPKSVTRIDSCFLKPSTSHDLCFPTETLIIANFVLEGIPDLVWTGALPSTLTDLSLIYGASLPLNHLHCLPTSLTRLETVVIWSNQDLEDAKKHDLATLWPTALTRLEVQTSDIGTFREVLPLTLTSLDLSEDQNLRQEDDLIAPPLPTPIAAVTPKRAVGWPSNLTLLTVRTSSNCEEWPTLPDSLTEFSWSKNAFNGHRIIGDHPMFSFPSQLETLQLSEWQCVWFHLIPRTVTDLTIYDLIRSPNATYEPYRFRVLPKSLTRLHISRAVRIQLSSTSLAHLCNLTDLSAVTVGLPSAAIIYLPKTMKCLRTRLTSLTPTDLRFLPLTLMDCQLGLDATQPEVFAYWPSAIAHLLPENLRPTANK